MAMRANVNVSNEIKNILIADGVLIVAFSLALAGGVFSSKIGNFIYYIPIVALAVTLNFVLHELMHKFVAQHYGAIAGFQAFPNWLVITLATGAFGFLIGLPGATMIYASRFTKKENGLVSLAGPLTNLSVFAVFAILLFAFNPPASSYLGAGIGLTIFVSLLLAFYNMLPIFPLDGSKVFAWSKPVYLGVMALLLVLLLGFQVISLYEIVFLIIIALFFSLMFRSVL